MHTLPKKIKRFRKISIDKEDEFTNSNSIEKEASPLEPTSFRGHVQDSYSKIELI